MARTLQARIFAMLGSLVLYPATPAGGSPLDGLHDLVGSWKCTYRAGNVTLPYGATWAYARDSRTLQQIDSFASGGAEELIAYDTQRGWTAVVIDDRGTTTIMRAPVSGSRHIAYRSVYPDSRIAVMFDRISSTKYVLHARVRSGDKTSSSVDICSRRAR